MGLITTDYDAGSLVATITMGRHAAHNALSTQMCNQLGVAIEQSAALPSARAIVLASSAKHFCVGADLIERSRLDTTGLDRARTASVNATFALLNSPLPIIAAIHGFALGGGLELALACDLIVADPTATFGLPEARIGIVPGGGGSQLLARRVGWGRATDLSLTSRRVLVDEAVGIGLVDYVADRGQAVVVAHEVAAEVRAGNPESIRLIRQAARDGFGQSVTESMRIEDIAWRLAAHGAGYQEGLAAFAARRPPAWVASDGQNTEL